MPSRHDLTDGERNAFRSLFPRRVLGGVDVCDRTTAKRSWRLSGFSAWELPAGTCQRKTLSGRKEHQGKNKSEEEKERRTIRGGVAGADQ